MCVGDDFVDLELQNNITFKGCEKYTYLRVKLSSEVRCEKEMERRITKGKKI